MPAVHGMLASEDPRCWPGASIYALPYPHRARKMKRLATAGRLMHCLHTHQGVAPVLQTYTLRGVPRTRPAVRELLLGTLQPVGGAILRQLHCSRAQERPQSGHLTNQLNAFVQQSRSEPEPHDKHVSMHATNMPHKCPGRKGGLVVVFLFHTAEEPLCSKLTPAEACPAPGQSGVRATFAALKPTSKKSKAWALPVGLLLSSFSASFGTQVPELLDRCI